MHRTGEQCVVRDTDIYAELAGRPADCSEVARNLRVLETSDGLPGCRVVHHWLDAAWEGVPAEDRVDAVHGRTGMSVEFVESALRRFTQLFGPDGDSSLRT